ncbi:MAG: hypothetical protein CMJ19_24025 [Phycisphaeraceae bacterium]|nr:hypothetical protein [Phycisphaeraceae bacterium]
MQLVKKRVRGIDLSQGAWSKRWAILCLVLGLIPTLVLAADEEPEYPFPAQVTRDKALVRAGVGTTYYVVKELKKGDIVTVDEKIYQWYKIVPPAGVHSYVSKAFVDAKGDGKIGVVNKTPCEVFTASVNGVADSFRRTANLLKGDTVQIVSEDGGYYKIVPPKGTYVYLPASSVEKVDFKPAVAETPVAPEPVQPVVTAVTPTPAPKPQPTPTAKPDFVIEKSEPIIMPDPEKTVITSTPKPVANVDVTPAHKPEPKPVVAPKPVETVAVAPVVEPKPEPKPVVTPTPKPTPTTVEITEPALRPLVINKPLPGDASTSTPAATSTMVDTTPQPVVSQPQPQPSVTSTPKPAAPTTPSTVRRSTPPIPDTETPPDFEGLPMHAANPNVVSTPQPVAVATPAPKPQPQPEFTPSRPSAVDVSVADTSLPLNTEELVVDKPAVNDDRLDRTVPAKPELPVVTDTSTPEPVVEMPAFTTANTQPVNDGTLPVVDQPVTTTPTPVSTPVATAEAAPVPTPTPTPQPQPAIAPKPTVNPLLSTRDYFKPQSEMLAKLEDRLVEAYNEPLDQIPLENYLNAYQQIGNHTALSINDQRIVQARELMIKRDIQLAKALRSIGSVQNYAQSQPQPQPMPVATPVQAPQPTETTYQMTGQLMASALYDGQNLPRLYRLVNPAQPSVTLIYVRPNDKLNPSAYLGRTVGINGEIQVDDALNLRLMDVEQIGLQ